MVTEKPQKTRSQSGMTLLEVLVGFVIFSASLVAILNYVSNQIYLNHLTEKNQHKAGLIDEYSALAALGEQAQIAFISNQKVMGVSVNSTPIEEVKDRNNKMTLVETHIAITDQGNRYEWSILEIK